MFQATLGESIVGKAQDNGFLDVHVTDFRDYTTDKHNHVDDAPFGGGAGMLLQAQPIFDAMAAIEKETAGQYPKGRVILMDPAGRKFDQDYAQELIDLYEKEVAAGQGQEGHYALDSSYEVVTDTDQYLSVRINTTVVMASGTQYVKIFTIDRKTGQILSLNDVLGNDSEMKKAVGENIKEQMRSQMAADSGITYFLDSETPEWDFTGLTGEEDFYFDSQGQLVIVFDEYEVAPGYMGAVEFTIPKSVTEN